jgi:glutaredoxin
MRKFLLPIVIVFATILLIAGGVMMFSKKEKQALGLPTTYEYYWSTTCPHCAQVQEFLDSWEGKDKLSLDEKEIGDFANSTLLIKRASYCNIPIETVGVPFLFTPEGQCLVGDEPIIEFFKGLSL